MASISIQELRKKKILNIFQTPVSVFFSFFPRQCEITEASTSGSEYIVTCFGRVLMVYDDQLQKTEK